MVGGELIGGGVEQGPALGGRGVIPGQYGQGGHAGAGQRQGAGAGQGAVIGRGRLHQRAQVAPGLIQHARIAARHPGLQRQGGAVQPQLVGHGRRQGAGVVHGGVQQGAGVEQGVGVAAQPGAPGAQAGVKGGGGRPGRRSLAGQALDVRQGGGQGRRAAEQVEAQKMDGRGLDRGGGGLVRAGGVTGGVRRGGAGALQADPAAGAARVLAPEGGRAHPAVERPGRRHPSRVDALAPGLDLNQIRADQLQPAEVLAFASLLEQLSQIAAEFKHARSSGSVPLRDGRMVPGPHSSKRSAAPVVRSKKLQPGSVSRAGAFGRGSAAGRRGPRRCWC